MTIARALTFPQRFLLQRVQRPEYLLEGYLCRSWAEERTAMALNDRGLLHITGYREDEQGKSRPVCRPAEEAAP